MKKIALMAIVLVGMCGCAAESVKQPARVRVFSGGQLVGDWKTDQRPVRWGPALHFRDSATGKEVRLLPGVIVD